VSTSGGSATSTIVGNQTPGDAVANPTGAVDVRAFGELWDDGAALWRRMTEADGGTATVTGAGSGIAQTQLYMSSTTVGAVQPVGSVAAAFHTGAGNDAPAAVGSYLLRPDLAAMNVQREGQFAGSVLTSPLPGTAAAVEGSATTAAGAQIVATLPAAAGITTWITGFDVTVSNGTAGSVLVTVAGIATSRSWYIAQVASGQNTLSIRFPRAIPSSAVNTAVTVTVPTTTTGFNSVVAYGFQL
jgi:hypothetical protein